MTMAPANKPNLKIRKVEIFHYTYRHTVLFNTKTVFVREGDERQQFVRFKLTRVFIMHRLNFVTYSGRCLATFRKNTLPQISTRLHGVITHKTTVTPSPSLPRSHKVYFLRYIFYTWLLVRLSNI
jgi:hypothetical protein